MSDMLVKLYALPSTAQHTGMFAAQGISIRRAMAYERGKVVRWVSERFRSGWADECSVAFARQPIGCYIALKEKQVCGFCCVEAAYRNFVGPIGVEQTLRGMGLGRGLVWTALDALRSDGYAYAIIGDAGEPGFFEKAVGAVEIPSSTPGPYPDKIK